MNSDELTVYAQNNVQSQVTHTFNSVVHRAARLNVHGPGRFIDYPVHRLLEGSIYHQLLSIRTQFYDEWWSLYVEDARMEVLWT